MKPSKSTKPRYNCYHIFFILERAWLLDARQLGSTAASSAEIARPSPPSATEATALTGYEFIEIPPLPPRYRHLEMTLPTNWYDPGRNKLAKRKHVKTHGVASFREIAKHVGDNWRSVDPVSKDFVETIALRLKQRHMEITKNIGCLNVAAPSSSPLTRMVTPNNGVVGASISPKIKQSSPKKKTHRRKYKKKKQGATAAKCKLSSAETTSWKLQEQQFCTRVSIMPGTDVSSFTTNYTMAQTSSSARSSSSIMDCNISNSNDEEELGALIYNSSRTAKKFRAKAEEGKLLTSSSIMD